MCIRDREGTHTNSLQRDSCARTVGLSKVRVKSKKQVLTGKAEERFTEVWVACDYVVKLYMVSIHGSGDELTI